LLNSKIVEQGSNVPRLALLKAGFPVSVPGVQINRKCGSSQSAIHFISQGIASGDIDIGIACGVEMMYDYYLFNHV
jgi:acetyl-CoA acetyltransferase